ncbi:plasmid transfer protein [Chondrinema litorale]|uniref:plasmid transfer protein n=1 Tax=Chondrinema litorale TaxID=2994555 RepID=UPI002543BE4E|nr:plasmid transfer protein [Chondrinema litorale]UZR99619.1 plasmid transfer protein [Chondrinema litorale]
MKLFFQLSVLCIFSSLPVFSQQAVVDFGVITTLVTNHKAQQTVLKKIKKSEGEIATAQKTIAVQMSAIKEIEEKMYKSLTNVAYLVKTVKELTYANEIAKDIGKYQSEMISMAGEDPELMLVAVKAEAALINRTKDLLEYILFSLAGGDANMMNHKERMDIMRYVVTELRIMRGIAYGVYRRMRVAQIAGVMKVLNPFGSYVNNGKAIAQTILKDLEEIKGKID